MSLNINWILKCINYRNDCDNYKHLGAVHCNIESSQPGTKQTVLKEYDSVI